MKKVIKFVIILFIIAVAILGYARYVGTMGLVTKEYTIHNQNIPLGFDGLKIVHFSDLHYNRAISITKVKSIVEEINLINPDIVVFTGDLVDHDAILTKKDYKELTDAFSKIKAKYGKYAVLGNHDYDTGKDDIISVYNNSDFKYLDNDYDFIYDKDNEKIFIGGINTVSYGLDDVTKTLEPYKENTDNDYKIIIVHEPDITDKIVNDYQVNLVLAGHSHNGQIRLPFIGALYTPLEAKKYYDNYYKINDTNLYISSGIGVSTINFRLFNPPSINFYRINKD